MGAGKRRRRDSDDDGDREQGQRSLQRTSNGLERSGELEARVRHLNNKYFEWVQEQHSSAPASLWTEAAREYCQYVDEILQEYGDTIKAIQSAESIAGGPAESKPNDEPSMGTLTKPTGALEAGNTTFQVTSSASKSSAAFSFGNASSREASGPQMPMFGSNLVSEASSSGSGHPSSAGGLFSWKNNTGGFGLSQDAANKAASCGSLFAPASASSTQAAVGNTQHTLPGLGSPSSTTKDPFRGGFGGEGASSQPLFGASAASSSSLTAMGGFSGLFGTTSTSLFGGASAPRTGQPEAGNEESSSALFGGASSSTPAGGASSASTGFGRFGAAADSAASTSGLLFGGPFSGQFGSDALQGEGKGLEASGSQWKPSGGTFAGLVTIGEDSAAGDGDAGVLQKVA